MYILCMAYFFFFGSMFLRFIHAIVFIISSFSIMWDSFLLYEYTLAFFFFLMHSSNDGHLDDFQLLALMNKYSIKKSGFVGVL